MIGRFQKMNVMLTDSFGEADINTTEMHRPVGDNIFCNFSGHLI